MGVVHADFAVAHNDDEGFFGGVIADLDGPEVAGDGDDLLHDAFLGLDDVESHRGAEGVEMVGAGAAPDGGQAEVLGGAGGSGDEFVVELAVVGLHDQGSAGAAEDGHVAVAGVAVKVGTPIFSAVQHGAGKIPNVGADGPPVFYGVGGVVGMGGREGEKVSLEGHGRSMLGTHVDYGRNVGGAFLLQFVLVDEHHVAGAVVENGGPFLPDIEVDRPVTGEIHVEDPGWAFDQVEVVAVGFEEDAAIYDVGGVGVAGNGDGEAAAVGGVDAPGAAAKVEFVLLNIAVFQVDDGDGAGLAVADEEASEQLDLLFLFPVLAVFLEDFDEIDGVDGITEGDDALLVAGRVFHQLVEPAALEFQADGHDHVGVGDLGHVLGAGMIGVGVGVRREQGEDIHPVLSDGANPVGDDVAGGDHVQHFTGLGGRGRSGGTGRRGGCRRRGGGLRRGSLAGRSGGCASTGGGGRGGRGRRGLGGSLGRRCRLGSRLIAAGHGEEKGQGTEAGENKDDWAGHGLTPYGDGVRIVEPGINNESNEIRRITT